MLSGSLYQFFPRALETEEVGTTSCKVQEFHLVEFPVAMIKLGKHRAGTLKQGKIAVH